MFKFSALFAAAALAFVAPVFAADMSNSDLLAIKDRVNDRLEYHGAFCNIDTKDTAMSFDVTCKGDAGVDFVATVDIKSAETPKEGIDLAYCTGNQIAIYDGYLIWQDTCNINERPLNLVALIHTNLGDNELKANTIHTKFLVEKTK